MTSAHIPLRLVRAVRERASRICEYCRLPQEFQEATFHIDHILPRSAGGKTTLDNLALACVSCSLHKATRLDVSDPLTQESLLLFHPRKDSWFDHFTWGKDWRLAGLTPEGRATIVSAG